MTLNGNDKKAPTKRQPSLCKMQAEIGRFPSVLNIASNIAHELKIDILLTQEPWIH